MDFKENELLNVLKYKYGLCPSGVEIFKNSQNDINRLATACVKWVELFIEHESSSMILNKLNEEELKIFNKNGIYYNQDLTIVNQNEVILLGSCKVNFVSDGFSVNQIYVLNNSDLNLTTKNNSKTWINIYHKAMVNVSQLDLSNVHVVNYTNQKVNGKATSIREIKYVNGEIFNYKYK